MTKEIVMPIDDQSFSALAKDIRKQLTLSQEDLARELGVSFATVNRWENEKSKPSKLARVQFDNYYAKMIRQGKLRLSGGDK